MEVKTKIIMKLSDLLQRGEAVTAALSLQPNSIAKPRRKFDNVCRRTPIFEMYQNPSPRTLKPLSYPAELRGTLTFPCYPANSSIIKCSCYQFSDDSGSLCCDILDFDPKMIGRSIRVPSWNFIPSPKSESRESNDGFLEILSWCYLLPCNENSCSLSAVCFFCLNFGVCDIKENPKAKYLLFGEIRSISPVSTVPCSVLGSNSSNITGFLASIFICDCKFCNGAFSVLEWIRMCEEKIKDHSFKKAVTVYFCRLSSSWHPVVSRLIGDVVLVTRLKKKLVFTGKNESQLMYVTADDVSLHIPELFRNFRLIHPSDAQSKVEYGCYSGIITGVYMQGMVVELDQDVMLLLTDQHLSVPHSMRVGAIVTLKNVHFVDPKFRWGKMLILGACCRTSVILKSFSPLETRGYLKSNYQSLLQKFIDRLLFSTRLWALLLISCLRKKFTGILSDKEILGTKREEGLAQKYASSHLPQSTFLVRHGLLLEFFKHESYFGGQGVSSDLQLVLPIANLISYCESSWKSFLDKRENDVDLVGDIKPRTTISCGGKIYARSIRKVLHTEDTGIHVVGMLKISPTSGGLQLMDSTGFIDVILDLPVAPEIDEIFEAKNFTIIMEGIPEKLVHLDSLSHRQLSCRSTFTSDPITRMLKLRTYLYHKPIHGNSRFRPCSPFLDCERNLKELKCGNFQLLMLTYKFPREHKFQVHRANISSMFAQAIVLPWELHITEKNKVTDAIQLSLDHLRSFRENFATYERCLTRKRYKLEHALTNSLGFGSDDTGNRFCVDPCTSSIDCHAENSFCILNYLQEFPCLIITRNVNDNGVGTLRNKNACQKFASCSKLPRDKEVLLEFSSERFCVFESLKIGGYYLFSDQEKDTAIIKTGNHQICPEKVFINLGTDFRSIVLSPVDGFQTSNIYTFAREFNSEINIIVPCNALNVLKSSIKGLPDGCTDTIVFDKEGFDTASKGGAIFDAPNLPSETTCSDYHLPEGKLVSLQGLIVALHDYKCCNFLAQSTHGTGDVCLPMFLRGNGSVCIHVSVDGHVARIIFDLSSQAHPIGLGPDTYATFHRILKLSFNYVHEPLKEIL